MNIGLLMIAIGIGLFFIAINSSIVNKSNQSQYNQDRITLATEKQARAMEEIASTLKSIERKIK